MVRKLLKHRERRRMNRIDQFRLFLEGWRRQSALLLDTAGCPVWLIRLRCPCVIAWGNILARGSMIILDNRDIPAADIQRSVAKWERELQIDGADGI